MSRFVLVVIGPPGSGKGTLADRFSREMLVPKFGMSDIIREYLHEIPWYEEEMNRGVLLADEYAVRLWTKKMNSGSVPFGLVLDGFPRTLAQLNALREQFNRRHWHHDCHFVFLKAEESVCCERVLGRGRTDDTKKVFYTRWASWRRDGLLLKYHVQNRLCMHGHITWQEIEANLSPDEIYYQVVSGLPPTIAIQRPA